MREDISPEEIAWVAGFLEGEGWFAYQGQRSGGRTRMRVGCGQVNREPLDRLRELFGGYLGFKKQRPEIRRSWWYWELSDQAKILDLTQMIEPWLSRDRLSRIPWRNDETEHVT